ncbi:MAG: SDR family oxidoreductase [Rhodospirillales bacterium]|nr:SDR family oxidoreductase [Rhodospirillales bacterium]
MAAKRILVTGADGFIGSHLTEALVRAGYTVRAFVYYNSFGHRGWLDDSPAEILGDLDVFAGDIRDPNGVREAVRGCDTVLHLAALIGIPFSYHSPDAYVDTNIKGTLNVLQAVRDLGVTRLVHTSTSEVYGTAQSVPITEDHPLQGQSPYAATKIAADQLALSFHRSFETPVAILRPFNTYGPRQSARAVLPTIITQLLSGQSMLELGSVAPTRDFNYVGDTVEAFLKAAETDGGAIIGDVVNIGSNFEISIGAAAQVIAEVIGVEAEIVSQDQRIRPPDSEVERLWADNARARERLGWEPAHGGPEGFRRGVAKTIEWYRQPENLMRFDAGRYHV